MNWLQFFAGPIGAFVNKAFAVASASFVSWEIAQGVPSSSASVIASGLVTVASTALSVFASKQGVKIAAINSTDNGVKVVASTSTSPQVNAALK